MTFRWLAVIVLSTWLIGPILDTPSGSPPATLSRARGKAPRRAMTPARTDSSQLNLR